MSNSFRYFNNSPEVIRLVVMMYVRYPLSLRNVEDLLAERRIGISHERVENLAFVVNRPPQPELPARDHHGHLIEMPRRRWPRASTAKFSGERRPEFQYPAPNRLIRDIETALGQ
jgi:hypothetical protein